MALEFNYKAPSPSVQIWTVSIYNWKTKKWVKLGDTRYITSKQWLSYTFTLSNLQRYISSKKEIRIQVRSNNANGDLKIDYEVLRINPSSSSAAQVLVAPTIAPSLTFTPGFTPTTPPSATPAP